MIIYYGKSKIYIYLWNMENQGNLYKEYYKIKSKRIIIGLIISGIDLLFILLWIFNNYDISNQFK